MFCGDCGAENPDTNSFCKNCGKALRRPWQVAGPVDQVQVTPAAIPAYQTLQNPIPGSVQPGVDGKSVAKHARNLLAIASFILSLVSWLVYPIIIGCITIVLGVYSLYRAKMNHAEIPVIAIIAIVIGLLAIIINFFWLDIFPAPAVLPPIR